MHLHFQLFHTFDLTSEGWKFYRTIRTRAQWAVWTTKDFLHRPGVQRILNPAWRPSVPTHATDARIGHVSYNDTGGNVDERPPQNKKSASCLYALLGRGISRDADMNSNEIKFKYLRLEGVQPSTKAAHRDRPIWDHIQRPRECPAYKRTPTDALFHCPQTKFRNYSGPFLLFPIFFPKACIFARVFPLSLRYRLENGRI